ncbi:MAG: endonuclease III [Anaerolineaceae bacterium]|nr:endonuclease III [Anaerolineaceae bacterium]
MKPVIEVAPEHRERLRRVNARLNVVFGYPKWREPLPAVDELVCTFLSQNTNDLNRDKAFSNIRARYASWDEVCEADPDEFMQVIRVAGLANQKGPNIQAALRRIREERGEIDLEWLRELPVEEAREWLLSFKGVGRKTAAIVLLFSLGMPAFPVDTHIYRVSGRIGLRPQAIDPDAAHRYLEAAADPADYYALHLNLIRLGREICKARKPACPSCPIADLCQFPDKVAG